MTVLIDTHHATYYPGNGCLVVDFREKCGTQLRFSSWAAGLRVDRWEDGKWYVERSDPGVSLLANGTDENRDGPMAAFLRSVPAEARAIAHAFDHCQTIVLRLLARSDHAMALGRNLPLVLWLVADAIDRGELDEDLAIWKLRKSPKEILDLLGSSSGAAAVQLLRRFRLPYLDESSLKLVRAAVIGRRSPLQQKQAIPLRKAS